MITITRNANGQAAHVHDDYIDGGECRQDWSTQEQAEQVAAELNANIKTDTYMSVDRGAYTMPRFDVIRVPTVGDLVSYSFNGDTYPCGEITTVSKTLKVVTTSTGERFYRQAKSGAWLRNKTWALVAGHETTQNESF